MSSIVKFKNVQASWIDYDHSLKPLYRPDPRGIEDSEGFTCFSGSKIIQLWTVALNLSHSGTLHLYMVHKTGQSYPYLRPVRLTQGDSSLNIMSILPDACVKPCIYIEPNFSLMARYKSDGNSTGQVVLNGCAEEHGVVRDVYLKL